MLVDFFATKLGMTQAWTKGGKRIAVTRCKADANLVLGTQQVEVLDRATQGRSLIDATILELGYGKKSLKNVDKPLRTRLEKSGISEGVRSVAGTRVLARDISEEAQLPSVGAQVAVTDVLSVGDVVQVQGVSKGRGFAGAVKRYGFSGGPKTHGQSDRHRAVGSIGAGTTPGRVWPGKRMPGHYGVETKTVTGLVVLHIDAATNEVWLSGPIPGSIEGFVKITKTGNKKTVELDAQASGLSASKPEATAAAEATQESEE